MRLAIAAVVLLAACGPWPSPAPTPTPTPLLIDVCHQASTTYGVQDPAVTQETTGSTICHPGWTRTIRPPVSYTDNLKRQQLALYGDRHPDDPNWTLAGTEEDHRLPLELGGAPRDPLNLS